MQTLKVFLAKTDAEFAKETFRALPELRFPRSLSMTEIIFLAFTHNA